jgi:hypothetical protein
VYKSDGLPDGTGPSQRIRRSSARAGRRAVIVAPIILTGVSRPSSTRKGLSGLQKRRS